MSDTYVKGFKVDGRWHYFARCSDCGWVYERLGVGWEFAQTIAVAHLWLKRGAP
ncbi:hypothetical protein [Streptomyces sp. S1]|uniref:hypothetical protein n=1 Tax=Streptomyces sp. S1 TaxID=718288 RepID=UPI003D70B5BB